MKSRDRDQRDQNGATSSNPTTEYSFSFFNDDIDWRLFPGDDLDLVETDPQPLQETDVVFNDEGFNPGIDPQPLQEAIPEWDDLKSTTENTTADSLQQETNQPANENENTLQDLPKEREEKAVSKKRKEREEKKEGPEKGVWGTIVDLSTTKVRTRTIRVKDYSTIKYNLFPANEEKRNASEQPPIIIRENQFNKIQTEYSNPKKRRKTPSTSQVVIPGTSTIFPKKNPSLSELGNASPSPKRKK